MDVNSSQQIIISGVKSVSDWSGIEEFPGLYACYGDTEGIIEIPALLIFMVSGCQEYRRQMADAAYIQCVTLGQVCIIDLLLVFGETTWVSWICIPNRLSQNGSQVPVLHIFSQTQVRPV